MRVRSHHSPSRGRVEVAHFNHGWRGDASHQDASFVQALADQLDLTLHLGNARGSVQTEESARKQRYEFLQHVAEARGARYLVLGHTADDQAETILHRILRGTGLKGLGGIRARRRLSEAVTIVRPALWASRDDVITYLKALGQEYRNDDSNRDLRFTRNRIRHELLPHLAENYNPMVVDALLRLGRLAQDAEQIMSNEIDPFVTQCVASRGDNAVELRRADFMTHSQPVQREILCAIWKRQRWPEQSMGYHAWSRLVEAIHQEQKLTMPSGIAVESVDNRIRLHRRTTSAD